jgi:hypothetical protein
MFGRMSSGTAALLAGGVAAAIPPVLVLGFDQPIWLGLGAAAGAFGALWGLARAGRSRPRGRGVDADAIAGARADTARDLLSEGQAALERLRTTARSVRDELMREEIKLLAMKAERVMREIRDHPDRVMAVRRLLSFYLPNAASVAEGWKALELKHTPAPEIELQTRETMAQLNDAFGQFADQAHQPQLQTLDLDLKVLRDAMKADLER